MIIYLVISPPETREIASNLDFSFSTLVHGVHLLDLRFLSLYSIWWVDLVGTASKSSA